MKRSFYVEPPAELLEKCLKRIHKEERFLVFKKLFAFGAMFIVSVAGFVPSFKMLLTDFSNSGFLHFFSLIFSDFSSVAAYWQSFSMILLETLPVISLAIFLAVLLTMLQSVKSITHEFRKFTAIKTI